ncbi:MAG TPA: YaeQ family protein, partial [Caldilineaceae bacterium]|nr:YaeQ family protein [Caldilineaceae bacterium]
ATQLLGQLSGKKIHRAGEIAIYSLDPRFVSALAGRIERRAKLSVTRSDGELFVEVAGENFRCPVVTHRLDNSPF